MHHHISAVPVAGGDSVVEMISEAALLHRHELGTQRDPATLPWRLESARNVTAIRRGNTVFRGADLSPAAVATTIGVETAREFFARETTEAPMSRRPIPHIPIHPLRLAFWLSSGWFWFQWWQREALLAMQTIERQLRPEARLALVRAEIPQEKRA